MCDVVFHNNLYVGFVDSRFSQLLQTGCYEPGRDAPSTKIWSYREMIEICPATVVSRHGTSYDAIPKTRYQAHTRITREIPLDHFAGIGR